QHFAKLCWYNRDAREVQRQMDGEETQGQVNAREGTAGQMRGGDEKARGRTVTRLTDPRALRAYAHPVRMALMGLLRTEGPLTATRGAQLLGESSGTCSFHLRQLAKYGLVEEAGGGTGREKPWRATTTSTVWGAAGGERPVAAATDADVRGRAGGRHPGDGRGGQPAEHRHRRTVLRAADTLARGQPGR